MYAGRGYFAIHHADKDFKRSLTSATVHAKGTIHQGLFAISEYGIARTFCPAFLTKAFYQLAGLRVW
jgi:hypothetical protein